MKFHEHLPMERTEMQGTHLSCRRGQCSFQSFRMIVVNLQMLRGGSTWRTLVKGHELSSVAQLCPTLCDPTDCSTPGFPVHHQLPELAQTHIHLILCRPFLLPPSIFPSIKVFSNELALCIRWPNYWSFSSSPSSEYSGLISFRIDWLDLLAVQGTLKVLSKTTIQKHHLFSTQQGTIIKIL